jgi:primosomal protein N' (replication factor Y)
MTTYAQIVVNMPAVTGIFDYALPPALEGKAGVGSLVTVPFGKQIVQGVILRIVPEPSVPEVKNVLDLLDPQPVLTAAQITLAQWLAEQTLASLAACTGLMIPAGLSKQADGLYSLPEHGLQADEMKGIPPTQRRLLDLLARRGPLRGRQIDRHFSQVDWRGPARLLVRQGNLISQSVLPPASIRPKYIRKVQLSVPLEMAQAALPELGKTAETQKRRQAALQFLMREPVEVEVAWVYAESGCNLADLQQLAERELVLLRESEIFRDPLRRPEYESQENQSAPVLTPDQKAAWDKIEAAFRSPPGPPFLLHGVTGSGKTELYLRGAQEALRRGKQALVLVPEIALTPQTVQRFLRRFPGQVGLVHSRLSEGERYDTWRRARMGLLRVIIGPRSALFTPLPNVGFIAVDECHDGSYYQSDPPFYSAVGAAVQYARICGAVCVLGSATPPVALRHRATPAPAVVNEAGTGLRLLELPERVEHRNLPPVRLVDMREELKAGRRGIFSEPLMDALEEVLKRGQQAILFLNRRGTATYIFCRRCGYTLKCPRCETPLTLHLEKLEQPLVEAPGAPTLLCHHCGYTRRMPDTCPVCRSREIRAFGLGSEKVEAEVKALFPSARTLRWDWETTRRKDSHEIILAHFSAHRADVLIGTQMLAKGLDLPLVTLVGIVLADLGLNLPDPFAAERTFDVLTQVAGRAGRSSMGGQVVLQTFQPENYVIQAAGKHDYASFYTQELEYRRQLRYPPFARLVRLEYRHPDPLKAKAEASRLAEKLAIEIDKEKRLETDLVGPLPCFFSRLNNLYRWQIILRGPDPAGLLRGQYMADWRVEVDPVSLL